MALSTSIATAVFVLQIVFNWGPPQNVVQVATWTKENFPTKEECEEFAPIILSSILGDLQRRLGMTPPMYFINCVLEENKIDLNNPQ